MTIVNITLLHILGMVDLHSDVAASFITKYRKICNFFAPVYRIMTQNGER